MKYLQYKPLNHCLTPYVDYYNSLVGDLKNGQSFISLPEGKVGIVFMLNGSESIDTDQESITRKQSHIHGLAERKTLIDTSSNIHTFSIIFKPTGLYHFLPSQPIDQIVKSYANISDVFGVGINETIDNIKKCTTDYERIIVIENFLLKHRNNSELRVEKAVQKILQCRGNIKVKEIAEYVNLSTRQFQTIFKYKIGLSPKQFTRLVRFKNVLNNRPQPEFTLASYANENGYFDESHFIHEFKFFTEMTPNKFFTDNQITSDFSNFKRILV